MRLRDPSKRSARKCGAYLGYNGYASILAMLKRPKTAQEVAAKTGVGASGVRNLLKQFHALRLIHRVGWVRPGGNGFDQPVYQLGDGEDVPARATKAGHAMPHADHRPKLAQRVVAFASVIHAMREPTNVADLSRESGLFPSRVTPLVAFMLSAPIRLIFIAGYEQRPGGSGPLTRLLQYGPDQLNARRPPRRQRDRSSRDRMRREARLPQWCTAVRELKRLAGIHAPRSHI